MAMEAIASVAPGHCLGAPLNCSNKSLQLPYESALHKEENAFQGALALSIRSVKPN